MTTEELANASAYFQTNRQSLIREQHWKTEKFPRRQRDARLIHIDASVRSLFSIFRLSQTAWQFYQAEEAFAEYANAAHSHAYRQIIDAVENISLLRTGKKLALFYHGKVFAISDAFRYHEADWSIINGRRPALPFILFQLCYQPTFSRSAIKAQRFAGYAQCCGFYQSHVR